MKITPIIFSGQMVRALLDDRKTQTRREVKGLRGLPIENLADKDPHIFSGRHNDPSSWGHPFADDGAPMSLKHFPQMFCPYGGPGDLLWVREKWALVPSTAYRMSDCVQQRDCPSDPDMCAVYAAGWERSAPSWRPSIHMPRWASRLTLRLKEVRFQRLHDISEEDVLAEGLVQLERNGRVRGWGLTPDNLLGNSYPAQAFGVLWDSINGVGSCIKNPWVQVLSFEVHQSNVDDVIDGRKP